MFASEVLVLVIVNSWTTGMPAAMARVHANKKQGTNFMLAGVMHCHNIKSLSCFKFSINGIGILKMAWAWACAC